MNPPRNLELVESASTRGDSLAVLVSGGLDSAILVAESLQAGAKVHPLYIRSGLFWEAVELHHLRHFLEAVRRPALQPLQVLEVPVADLYGKHWSLDGADVPPADSADEAVFLPGRNVLLLSKALIWCHLYSVSAVALGTLASNPFPDATPAFFNAIQSVVNQALGGYVEVLLPYATTSKNEVMLRGREWPLQWTFSCIRPIDGHHCGLCNKCAERRRAFAESGLTDPTIYTG